ncbi:MAG: 2-ketoarginine methyltransferase [Xenococcaceae cyanobacterium]
MNFEQRTVNAIQPIRFHVLAAAIYHLLNEGIYDRLLESPVSFLELVSIFGLDYYKSEGFFRYLANEKILNFTEDKIELTHQGRQLNEVRGWYHLMIGGYIQTYMQIGEKLRKNSGWTDRDSCQVGVGSCQISHYDAIPLTQRLIEEIPKTINCLLDVGCGSAEYLIEFCKLFPKIKAIGIEQDYGSYKAALGLVRKENLGERIALFNTSALDCPQIPFEQEPDLAIVNYVLQEILSQDGEKGVVQFLSDIISRFPNIYFIVIEVENQFDNKDLMSQGLALAGYNPYFLIHHFTNQRLEKKEYWENLFSRCRLEVLAQKTTDPQVDSTGLEIGYLLKVKS